MLTTSRQFCPDLPQANDKVALVVHLRWCWQSEGILPGQVVEPAGGSAHHFSSEAQSPHSSVAHFGECRCSGQTSEVWACYDQTASCSAAYTYHQRRVHSGVRPALSSLAIAHAVRVAPAHCPTGCEHLHCTQSITFSKVQVGQQGRAKHSGARYVHGIAGEHKGIEHTNFSALFHYADTEVLVGLLAFLRKI